MWSKAHNDFRNFSKRRVNNSQFVTFFGYFLPSYFQKNVQMTLNFQRKAYLFNCIGCINLITDQYLEIRRTPKNQFLRKFEKKSIFWHYLSFKLCKHVLNVLKILEKLLLYDFYMISKNDKNSKFFALVVLLQKDVVLNFFKSIFKSNLFLEDDAIEKF